jgi:hypothetical protein
MNAPGSSETSTPTKEVIARTLGGDHLSEEEEKIAYEAFLAVSLKLHFGQLGCQGEAVDQEIEGLTR